MSEDSVMQNQGRREFLLATPVAALAGMLLADTALFTPRAEAQSAEPKAAAAAYKYFPAQTIDSDISALEAKPGSTTLVNSDVIAGVIQLGVEKQAKQAEFEWHETRDHVFHVLDGATVYEVGGTAKNPRNIAKGEWKATEVEGATTIALGKGDLLVLPRNTIHKRSTPDSVKFMLVSCSGTVSG